MIGLRNGGPAFPGTTVNDTDVNLTDPWGTLLPPQGQATYSGMSLRAHFAGLAMQAALTHPATDPVGLDHWLQQCAAASVKAADALLAELAK